MPVRVVTTGLPQMRIEDSGTPFSQGLSQASSTLLSLMPQLARIKAEQAYRKQTLDQRSNYQNSEIDIRRHEAGRLDQEYQSRLDQQKLADIANGTRAAETTPGDPIVTPAKPAVPASTTSVMTPAESNGTDDYPMMRSSLLSVPGQPAVAATSTPGPDVIRDPDQRAANGTHLLNIEMARARADYFRNRVNPYLNQSKIDLNSARTDALNNKDSEMAEADNAFNNIVRASGYVPKDMKDAPAWKHNYILQGRAIRNSPDGVAAPANPMSAPAAPNGAPNQADAAAKLKAVFDAMRTP